MSKSQEEKLTFFQKYFYYWCPTGLCFGVITISYIYIYINDLPMVSDVFNMLMYADDTTLYCNIDQNVSEEVINNELSKISQWLANK